ncbi:MAG: DUF2723 domain-containing protein [Bacteroidales bacterium]|nr:DUF2723 domain-containing protein [Bacteroidales bacterium]
MDKKQFKMWNLITSLVVLAISAFTYISTIEPSASFWDCGEFIASSYKLEVGHPPGNPVFQLIARFFTLFTGASGAAVAVNIMSALCSAATIFFLYLTIVFFAKRLFKTGEDGNYTMGASVAIMGAGAVGALAYCFSDTFWFSAVEGEVYAMSSLFTAIVFWAMTKWYEQADRPGANRWIVLISFLMGLSIGVHLLNLLAIPAIVFMYYYRARENTPYTFWEMVKIALISIVILGVLNFIIIPWVPKLAAYSDLLFNNTFGLPINFGAAFFMVVFLGLCFLGLFWTMKKGKVLLNTILLCFTCIMIGFSIFSIVIIRSSVMPPSNENQPDNAFALVRYLSREQYGSQPLVYGQYFDAPYEISIPKYWARVGDSYKKSNGPMEADYSAAGKMLFPRMWSSSPDGRYESFYESYMGDRGTYVQGATYKKPAFFDNIAYFLDYQCNWMYWRYFMWNFAGRQNDVHSPSPGNRFYGNWESGISFIDNWRLGDQSEAPEIMSQNKGKNHYYMLPLLLGLIGLFFQFSKDRRGSWLVFLMFFMTGLAIVMYLNQPPYQVRERDYAYAGSFYMFAIWIGFAVMAVYKGLSKVLRSKGLAPGLAASALCLFVPALMAQQNWDDHDRSNRATAVELAKNYLNSVGPNGYIITHGDNDTFPLWYAQEVEGIRTDVRVLNTSLLGTDWYIGQMKYASNESAPIPLSVSQEQYLYGTNDFVYIYDTRDTLMSISDVMTIFRHPKAKLPLRDGRKVDYIASRKISVPVNKENAIKYGIVPKGMEDLVEDQLILELSPNKEFVSKQELFFLDLLDNYQWDRPLNMLSQGGDVNIGFKKYLMYEGFSAKLVPIKNSITVSNGIGLADVDDLYNKLMNVYSWDALKRQDYCVDYQNLITFLGTVPQREVFVKTADALLKRGDKKRAIAVLDKCQECVPYTTYPLESVCIGFASNDIYVANMIRDYYEAGAPEKARELVKIYAAGLVKSANFFVDFYDEADTEYQYCVELLYELTETMTKYGDRELAKTYNKMIDDKLKSILGEDDDFEEELTEEVSENTGDDVEG